MTVDTRTYDDGGRMISSSYNNGVSQTRAYNSDNTLASITHAGAAIGSYTYNWDANKNKTAEAVSGVLSGFGFTVPASGYNGEDRLTAWNRSDNALSKAWNLSLVGDWNCVTENSQTRARTHGPTHELLSAAGQLIEHDVKGNTTKIPAILRTTDAANPQPDLNLSWDFDNRMRSASDGAVTVTYSFDALGRRVARTDSATTVVYVQNGQQTVADYPLGAAAPSPTSTYVYASYIDDPVLRTSAGGDRYYHRNQQHSIVALTGGGGTITERYAYDAYGTPTITDASGTSLTTSADNSRYTYTGREYDEALGLYHYRARMYDSVAGRFCSRDPIGYVDGYNFYAFLMSRPTAGTDPTGEATVSNIVPCVASDHAICNAACKAQGKLGGRAQACALTITSITTPCHTAVWRTQYQKCKCFNKRNICWFYYQWCKRGANLPSTDPGKPFWPNSLSKCDACYAKCKASGKWTCNKGGGRRGPRFPKPNEPWGPSLPSAL